MVVRAVSGDTAYCQWYAGVDLHQGTFLFTSLRDIGRERRAAAAAWPRSLRRDLLRLHEAGPSADSCASVAASCDGGR